MTMPECLEGPGFEVMQGPRPKRCGLLDWENPVKRGAHEVRRLEVAIEALFDDKCDDSDGGWVMFDDKPYRLDHRMEEDELEPGRFNEIRSVVEVVDVDQYGRLLCKTRNLINHWSGTTYLEVHESIEGPEGVLLQPEIGGAEVYVGTHADVVLHYQVALDADARQHAAPLPVAA